MKIQTLQALARVEELGSIRAAAESLHISQPALTAAIHQLEEELAAPLLVRTKQGATLTTFGLAFMRHARVILSESQRAREEIEQLRGHWEGTVRFATSPAVALSVLPPALQAFSRKFPNVEVHCRDGLYPGITPMLRNGTLDFGLTPVHKLELEPDLAAEPLFVTEIVIVCRRSHPLQQATSLAQLADCAWVYSTESRGPGAAVEEAFATAGLAAPRRAMICESFLALPGIVAHSEYMATVPRKVFEMNAFRDALCRVPVADSLPCPTVSVVRRHDLPLTPATLDLIGWIKHFAQLGPTQPGCTAR